jgi:AP-2 complex subunit sigma-1
MVRGCVVAAQALERRGGEQKGFFFFLVSFCRYQNYNADEKHKLAMEIHKVIVTRPRGWTNFIDFHEEQIVYRRYAGLYFCLCVDRAANELATLELIHLFVETLDTYFGSVCELDLVFNFFNCIQLWDEICIGGEPVETSRKELLDRMGMLKLMMKDGGKTFRLPGSTNK